MNWTPNDIEILLWYYTRVEPHPHKDAPACKAIIEYYLQRGIFEIAPIERMYMLGDRGKKWVEMILNTPFPEQRWIDPRFECKQDLEDDIK